MTKKPTYEELEQRVIKLEEVLLGHEHVGKELLLKENIITSSSSVIATCDLEGKMTYGNPSFLKTWGFDDAKEFLGRHFSDYWVVKEILDEIMQTLLSEGKWFGEIKARRKDGTLFDVQVLAATVYDAEGSPVALTSTSIDVTGRKLMEEALRESEIKHKTLVNNIPGMVYRAYPDWSAEIISGSEAICDYTEKELNSKEENWLSIIHHDDKERVLEAGSELTQAQKDLVQIYRIKTKGGDIRWVEDRKTSIFSEKGRFIGIDGIVFNITERKQAEEEREKLINELQEALKEIKTLRGILPLCSFCKKIRDDKGYWEQVDVYIHKHSQADISHSLCPDCSKDHYPDYELFDD